MPVTTTVEPEMLDIRTVSQMGHGHPATIRARIRRGDIPAYRSGGKFKIRRVDLSLLTEPVGSARLSIVPTQKTHRGNGRELDDLTEQIVAMIPQLSDEQKREIGRLLGEGS